MSLIKFKLVGGELDGTVVDSNIEWWGFRYKNGEYNTLVHKTFRQIPAEMYWRKEGDPPRSPDWELSSEMLDDDLKGEELEDYIKRLLAQANEQT